MPLPTLSLTQSQALTVLGNWLLSVCTPSNPAQGFAVFRGQDNRVPEPSVPDFAVMTPILQSRLGTNETTYADNVLTGSIAPATFAFVGSVTPYGASQGLLTAGTPSIGPIVPGVAIVASGVPTGAVILYQLSGTAGGAGNYLLSASVTAATTAMSGSYGLLDVTHVSQAESSLAPGMTLIDSVYPVMNVASNTAIVAQLSGSPSGGVGTYAVLPSQSLSSETLYAGVRADAEGYEWTVQCDIHGPASPDNVRVVEQLFRSEIAVDAFAASGLAIAPLWASDPRQAPFLNENTQIEYRWTIDLKMQVDSIVSTSIQFADELEIEVIEAAPNYTG